MVYKKIELTFDEAKERFSRTLLVKENVNLVILGAIFCSVLKTEFEHCFYFIKNRVHYSPDVFIEEGSAGFFNEVPMKKYKLKDMGSSFKFIYDTGENWVFSCKVLKKDIEIKGKKLAYLVDGKGQGIWEDNIGSLMAYLNGELDPESNKEDEKKGYYLPWNFNNSKYGDFDHYDLEESKESFDLNLIGDINDYLNGAHSCGYELEVKLLKDTEKRRVKLPSAFGPRMDVEDLIISKTETDLLSSLKNINLDYAKKYMSDNSFDNYKEWKDSILESFKICMEESIDSMFTIDFFKRLILCENSTTVVAYADDVFSNYVFLYRDEDGLKYYIPNEIKKIVTKYIK